MVDDQSIILLEVRDMNGTEHWETEWEGSTNWYIYLSYIDAGADSIVDIFLVVFVFDLHQVISVYYNWWLPKWNDNENYRYQYRDWNNCTDIGNQKIKRIQAMHET